VSLHEDLRAELEKLAGESNTEEVRRRMLQITEDAVRAAAKNLEFKSNEQSRDQRRDQLAETFYQQLPDKYGRLGAAAAAAYLFEPFLYGLPDDFDPRDYLQQTPDVVLDLLCERFEFGEVFPSNLAWYERMRRRGDLLDWEFERKNETSAGVKIQPSKPAEFITVTFSVSEEV